VPCISPGALHAHNRPTQPHVRSNLITSLRALAFTSFFVLLIAHRSRSDTADVRLLATRSHP
jgi:hypothetical protein